MKKSAILMPFLIILQTDAVLPLWLHKLFCYPNIELRDDLDKILTKCSTAAKLALTCDKLTKENIEAQETKILQEPETIKVPCEHVYSFYANSITEGSSAYEYSYLTPEEILREKICCRTEGCVALQKLFDKADSAIREKKKQAIIK